MIQDVGFFSCKWHKKNIQLGIQVFLISFLLDFCLLKAFVETMTFFGAQNV